MYKVLIVEDNLMIAEALSESIKEIGYEVEAVVHDGDSAIRNFFENVVDVVLMDIELNSDMDGIETAEKIKALYDVPLIYLTGNTDPKILNRAKATMPDAFLIKPFKIEDVKSNIDIAIHKHKLLMERKLQTVFNHEVDYQSFLKSLGLIFKNLRKQKALSQVEFAQEMDVNYRHYQDLEGGKSNLKLETLFKLAKFYQLSIPELFDQSTT